MRPCDCIIIRLLSVQSSRPDGQKLEFEEQGKNAHDPTVSVQHIANSADYSFIKESRLQALLMDNCDSSFPDIEIDDDTIVVIRWHYPGYSRKEVTTKHLVVRESHFDIILRIQDWENPIREFLQHVRQPQSAQPHSVQQGENSEPEIKEPIRINVEKTEHFSNMGLGNESEIESNMVSSGNSTRRSSVTTVFDDMHKDLGRVARRDANLDCRGDDNEEEESEDSETTVGNDDRTKDVQMSEVVDDSEAPVKTLAEAETEGERDVDWGDIEIYDTPQEGSDGMHKNAYWDWSPQSRRFYHKDPTGGIRWFPEPSNDKRLLNTSHSWPCDR